MKTKKTKCYIYTRVFTAMQVDGYSLDAQKEKLKHYADYEEMKIVGEYSDEGHSGKNINGRPKFVRMFQDIEDCKDDIVANLFSRIIDGTNERFYKTMRSQPNLTKNSKICKLRLVDRWSLLFYD